MLVDEALADAAERLGVAADELAVLDARAVTWRDNSLGCPQPGTMYLQRLTPGYLVVVGSRGRRLEDHSGPLGPARYCADPRPPLPDDGGAAEGDGGAGWGVGPV